MAIGIETVTTIQDSQEGSGPSIIEAAKDGLTHFVIVADDSPVINYTPRMASIHPKDFAAHEAPQATTAEGISFTQGGQSKPLDKHTDQRDKLLNERHAVIDERPEGITTEGHKAPG